MTRVRFFEVGADDALITFVMCRHPSVGEDVSMFVPDTGRIKARVVGVEHELPSSAPRNLSGGPMDSVECRVVVSKPGAVTV